jgi:hypothetical protein
MALQHFTRCVDPALFEPRSIPAMVAKASAITAALTALALLAGHPACIIVAVEIGTVSFFLFYTDNFLNERLVCLGGDEVAVGMVLSVEEPHFDFWDNDFSVNLLLCGSILQESDDDPDMAQAAATPFGRLISTVPPIPDRPARIAGSRGQDKKGTGITAWALHAEFEGSGPYALMQLSLAMLGIASIAFLLCLAVPPGFDWLIALLVLLLMIAGGIAAHHIHPGSPNDVNPDIPTIEVNSGGRNAGAHVLYLEGTWVWDSLHNWDEIHPIKVCCLMGTWEGSWAPFDCAKGTDPDQGGIILRLKREFELARAEETLANQARPEHQWRLHPDLDGCSRDIIL